MSMKLTLGELKRGVDRAIQNGISEGAVILWSTVTNDGDCFCTECDAAPGSVLFGMQYFEDGDVITGTLQIQPDKISDILS